MASLWNVALIIFDDMIAVINIINDFIVKELFIRCRKLNISHNIY